MGAFIPPSGYQKAVLSPDWERLITTGSKSVSHRRSAFSSVISDLPNVKVWDRRTGREIYALDGELAYTAANSKGIAWCPDGTKLAIASSYLPSATGSFTGLTATVVDARSGKVLFTLKGHTRAVVSVAWSRDGKRLATGSDDRTVKVWDTGNGKELMTLSSGSQPIVGLAWSPDGKRLAAAHQFGAVEIYAVDVQILMVLARQHITAHPSEEGCQTYFHDKCPSFPHLSISKAVEGH
jgi:WD40 repeat protein